MKNTDRIDFISAYCDSWCERCAYTSRCSAFAVQAAIAMCGDTRDGFELAIGTPHPVEETRGEPDDKAWLGFENVEISAYELSSLQRSVGARIVRVEETSIMKRAWKIPRLSLRWLARAGKVRAAADDVLREALDIVRWDATFVLPKLARALDGRDRHEQGEDCDDDPVQNDWNGSAKVALISLERSEVAWRVIAQSTGDADPAALAEQIAGLRREVETTFPNARSFIRPGFDEPDR